MAVCSKGCFAGKLKVSYREMPETRHFLSGFQLRQGCGMEACVHKRFCHVRRQGAVNKGFSGLFRSSFSV